MPRVNWMYLCDYATKDISGKTSIIGMFNSINVLKLPARYQQIFTIMEVEKTANESFELEVFLSSPSEKEITKRLNRKIGAQADSNRVLKTTLIYAFYGIQFEELGAYHAVLNLNGECIHTIPFNVRQLKLKKEDGSK